MSVYIRRPLGTSEIMLWVLVSLCPSLTAAVWYFGFNALLLSALSVAACVITELLWQVLTGQTPTVSDLSAAVTGLLIALSVPVTTPVWAILLADVTAIAVAKQLFGGIGQNIFNPALVGRAVLLLGATGAVTDFVSPYDAVSSATPLTDKASVSLLISGSHAGSMGETCALLLIFGFGLLYCKGFVSLYAPLGMLGTLALLTFAFGTDRLFAGDATAAVLGGSALFGAFFMVTDYSTTPTTSTGRMVFGIGVGVLTFALRKWGGTSEGVCFAVLTMNLFSPLIEELTAPTPYGKAGNGYERKHEAVA